MSTTSGGDANTPSAMQENSVTTVYNGDRTDNEHHRLSPSTSSNGDSGLDNSNTSSSAGDAKLIIDVPDFSKVMESPRTGIDNPSFETDKSDIPKPQTNGHNGHNGTVHQENGKLEKEKMAEAVNLELINMKPFGKSLNGNGISVPTKKKETAVNMNDSYDDYFIPVNEHKKYIRGGEKLYVTKDKRDLNQSRKPFICWVFGLVLLAAAVIVAILASTGVIFNNEAAMESRNFAENEKIAGFGNRPGPFSSVSPPPSSDGPGPFSPPTTDMSEVNVPRTIQGEIVIDNMEFTPGLANKSSPEFEALASSIEGELKRALFEEQMYAASSDIHVKVFEFTRGSVVAMYRVGWENKNDVEMPDPITVETLKERLDSHLRASDGFLYNYRIPVHRLRSEHVKDLCKSDNAKCSHYCSYDYTKLDFVCSCPSELMLSENMKDCKQHSVSEEMDDFSFHDINAEFGTGHDSDPSTELDDSSPETKSEPNSEPEIRTEPEPNSEPETKAEPEPEVKAEPEPNSEPEIKAEPEPSSEPEIKTEPEPSSEPEVKAEPEPSSEPEVKAEPEPEVKAEPEPSSEPEVKADSEPKSEPEVKAETEHNSEHEIKAEPEPSSEPEVKAEPEPNSETPKKAEPVLNSEPEVKVVPEPSLNPEVKAEPEPSSEPEVKAEPEPSSEPEVKVVPEPSFNPEVKAEPEPNSEPEVKAEPEPSLEPEVKSESEPNSEPETKAEPEPSSEPEVKAEPVPSSEPEVKVVPEPISEPEVKVESELKAEPEPKSEPEVKAEPEPNSEPEVKAEPESKSEPEVKAESEPKSEPEVKAEPEPEPKLVPESESSLEPEVKVEPIPKNETKPVVENFESLSDVDISSENDSSEGNSKSSAEKSLLPETDQTDREAKAHAGVVFDHEIKPEMTYAVSTEFDFETKTESAMNENSKKQSMVSSVPPEESMSSESGETTTWASITDNWLTSSQSSVRIVPKLPNDLEVTDKENSPAGDEIKLESSTTVSSSELTESEPQSEDQVPKIVSKVVTENYQDSEAESSSSSGVRAMEVMSNPELDNGNMSTLSPLIAIEPVKDSNNLLNPLSLDKSSSNELSLIEKVSVDVSSPRSIDNFDDHNSADDSLDHMVKNMREENFASTRDEDDISAAFDLFQKPETKKKDKKTSKTPELYMSESGFTKRNKTKSEKEKENKKTKVDSTLVDMMMPKLVKCADSQIQCTNGTTKDGSYCISASLKCDSNKDCSDNSDEDGCLENACFGNFQCKSGECLQRNLVCNSIMDCEDGSDELACDEWKCVDGESQCAGGQCLPTSYFCDGKSHCNGNSDELNCNSTCDGFQCSNGYCIKDALRCNGVNECPNGEDEEKCVCFADQFKCNTGSQCISKSNICDGIPQCNDQSDEWQCIQLDGSKLMAKKQSESSMEVCNTNWSNDWSDFVCHNLGFSEAKSTNGQGSESSENPMGRLKLKEGVTLDVSKKLPEFLEVSESPCDSVVEIKCSSKHLCGDFGGKDPHSMDLWPSVVYLRNTKTDKSCTASLVKRDWLLSSYSCMHSVDQSLAADQWESMASKSRVSSDSAVTKRSVTKIVTHPGVKYEKLRYFNDTVLVQLAVPYNLSDDVNTVCLPDKMADDKQPCVTAGWAYESPGVFKQFSRYLSEPLMPTSLCNSPKYFNDFLAERELCVASAEMETTHMEIGSPLMCLAENGLWQLQGVLSYVGGHGRSSKPSVFNPIAESVQWIEYTTASGNA
ncbi:uncharacterized protein LOC126848042 isoform X2 [Adelges cooleyi]|uniref:uncharacterized protein LOC126848042 isoform X2 n=1 Tax=Adelges cooleyi TaxID=133065 RepID=UPI00217F3DA6|nr:uncharacterized protein LOC126848042 isoform X2 [Adelges cooleyi]